MSIGFQAWLCCVCGCKGAGPFPLEHQTMCGALSRGDWCENGGGI